MLAGDIAAVARVLYALPAAERSTCLARLMADAERADAYRLRTGRVHPEAGTGSLMSATSRMQRADEPDFDDAEYCRCWILTLEALVERRPDVAARGTLRPV